MSSPKPGSFEYLESKIRRDADGTLFGREFEWVCQWYLEHAPLYRGKFRKVWRWAEWPDRWGPDCGVDLIAEAHDGKLWAIQAKAIAADRSITKSEVDSFLAESNRRQIAYRLLIATTDDLGGNARRTIDQQAKRVSFVGRGDLLNADLVWPAKVGGSAPRPARAKPRPHQRAAIAAVLRGFRRHARGRLIMACGTGKTLTGLWIRERLKSRRTLLLVPSISLVQQNLREWGRHAREDFDCLVVCSDESVASDRDDPALRYIAELGIDVTTDAAAIAAFLAKRRRRPAVVIATYQSSDRVSKGQRRARKAFDLALCDEAHRLVGDVRGKFATILDDRKIRCRRRLFMTATPRYFTQRAKDRAADHDLEVASMDDGETFGPEFHVLNFYDAITAKPTPLLTDYRVVVIGVTNAEAAAWVEEGKLVRTRDGAQTDARTLAAQIGLAKAIREYDLRRIITFHRSIRRASRFVESDRRDSLPAVVGKLRPPARPSGRLWARHISGETPASKRATMLRSLAELPADTRGLIANCACLGEGVDVPALDGIAFIDPKGSVVDIIQAVGRVIRLSQNKTIGTIVIPVFIDESGDAETALEQSVFDPVWQVLKALRAHDSRLADELDTLRTSIGRQRTSRVRLPESLVLDVPTLAISDFEQSFYVRAIERVAERPPLTIDQILLWADNHRGRTGAWPTQSSGMIPETDESWRNIEATLHRGGRGIGERSSIAQILEAYRGRRNPKNLPPLSDGTLKKWIATYKKRHKCWPSRESGQIAGTQETWLAVDRALKRGSRGRSKRSSLADFLSQHFGVRNTANLLPLRKSQILRWLDEHHKRTGGWPTAKSGRINGTTENWMNVDAALMLGLRSLPGGSSLARLLTESGRNQSRQYKKRLSVAGILAWADGYHRRYKRWPNISSGAIAGTNDTWSSIDYALRTGARGLPKGRGLAAFLVEHRQARKKRHLSELRQDEVLFWCDCFHEQNGRWPTQYDGAIPGTTETWATLNTGLRSGRRGIAATTLADFLCDHRNARNDRNLPSLTVDLILSWADQFFSDHGRWPKAKSGPCGPGILENWRGVDNALRIGYRGLRGGSSLAKLLDKYRRNER